MALKPVCSTLLPLLGSLIYFELTLKYLIVQQGRIGVAKRFNLTLRYRSYNCKVSHLSTYVFQHYLDPIVWNYRDFKHPRLYEAPHRCVANASNQRYQIVAI